MIYSVGRKPTAQDATSRDSSGSGTISELSTENFYAIAEHPSRRLPILEETDSFSETQALTETRAEKLAACILQRIESRLPCRIRKLRVFVAENAVVLEGQCSTYYTKQIAQHTAMGVLEYERLTNHIEVCSAK